MSVTAEEALKRLGTKIKVCCACHKKFTRGATSTLVISTDMEGEVCPLLEHPICSTECGRAFVEPNRSFKKRRLVVYDSDPSAVFCESDGRRVPARTMNTDRLSIIPWKLPRSF